MTPLSPYEHLDPDPLDVQDERERYLEDAYAAADKWLSALFRRDNKAAWQAGNAMQSALHHHRGDVRHPSRRPRPSRAVIGWLLVSLAVVLFVGVSVALFLRGFGA